MPPQLTELRWYHERTLRPKTLDLACFFVEEEVKHVGTKQIETERLILRRFKLSDAKEMFKNYAGREKVTDYLPWSTHKNIDDTKKYLSEIVLPAYKNSNTYRWAIIWKETQEVIGCIDVAREEETTSRAELGWVLGDEYWGRGIMPEAGKEVLKYLFDVGYVRIQAKHHVMNPKSGRVMEKIGMTHEGTLKKYTLDKYGNLVDVDMWAIIKEEEKENEQN